MFLTDRSAGCFPQPQYLQRGRAHPISITITRPWVWRSLRFVNQGRDHFDWLLWWQVLRILNLACSHVLFAILPRHFQNLILAKPRALSQRKLIADFWQLKLACCSRCIAHFFIWWMIVYIVKKYFVGKFCRFLMVSLYLADELIDVLELILLWYEAGLLIWFDVLKHVLTQVLVQRYECAIFKFLIFHFDNEGVQFLYFMWHR